MPKNLAWVESIFFVRYWDHWIARGNARHRLVGLRRGNARHRLKSYEQRASRSKPRVALRCLSTSSTFASSLIRVFEAHEPPESVLVNVQEAAREADDAGDPSRLGPHRLAWVQKERD